MDGWNFDLNFLNLNLVFKFNQPNMDVLWNFLPHFKHKNSDTCTEVQVGDLQHPNFTWQGSESGCLMLFYLSRKGFFFFPECKTSRFHWATGCSVYCLSACDVMFPPNWYLMLLQEIQDRIRIIELYAKDRQFADFVRQHQAWVPLLFFLLHCSKINTWAKQAKIWRKKESRVWDTGVWQDCTKKKA